MRYVVEKRSGVRGVVKGRDVVIFSTNDYLSLSAHPAVIGAAGEALRKFGAGTGGAPGTTGTTSVHELLSRKIASFKSREKAVLFPSGYQANIAIHHSLGIGDTVFFLDRRHHPSAIDGARLPRGSRIVRFDHQDLGDLEKKLGSDSSKKKVVSLPSVFTVDGAVAPLERLIKLKDKYGFILVLDEAHATGCLGRTGKGIEEHFGLKGAADFIMGTFSKAIGSSGGFVAYDDDHRDLIKNEFRQYEYSTSLSAVSVAAALKALELMESDPEMISSLWSSREAILSGFRREGIGINAGESMIMTVPCENAGDLQRGLLSDGYLVMVTETEIYGRMESAIRITANAGHSPEDIERFCASFKKNLNK